MILPKFKRNRFLIVALVVLGVLATMVFSVLPESREDPLSGGTSLVFRPIQRLVQGARDGIVHFFSAFSSANRLQAENERLKQENIALRLQIKDNEQAAEAYEDLRDAFHLKALFKFNDFQAAHVLNPGQSPFFDLQRLDVGILDGVDLKNGKQFPVLDQYGHLAGRIYASDLASSKLLPLLHEGFAMNCSSKKDRLHTFRLRGDLRLKSRGLCVADQIPKEVQLKKGDVLISSGQGGLFPEGIEVGEVVELRPGMTANEYQAVVKPFIDWSKETVLFVLLGSREQVNEEDATP